MPSYGDLESFECTLFHDDHVSPQNAANRFHEAVLQKVSGRPALEVMSDA